MKLFRRKLLIFYTCNLQIKTHQNFYIYLYKGTYRQKFMNNLTYSHFFTMACAIEQAKTRQNNKAKLQIQAEIQMQAENYKCKPKITNAVFSSKNENFKKKFFFHFKTS